MYTYLLNRLGMTILVLLIVITFLSLLIQFIPGDPVRTLLGPRATPDLSARIAAKWSLTSPFIFRWLIFSQEP